MGSDFFSSWSLHTFTSFLYLAYPNYSGERYNSDDPLDFIQRIVIVDKMSEADGKQGQIHVYQPLKFDQAARYMYTNH